MVYDGYHFWEMHVIWWFIWLLLFSGFFLLLIIFRVKEQKGALHYTYYKNVLLQASYHNKNMNSEKNFWLRKNKDGAFKNCNNVHK